MFIFKEYNPLKHTFAVVQSENSSISSPPSTPPPQTLHIRTPEVPEPLSLPSSAVRHASNALVALGGYVSNAFQQFTASVSRTPHASTRCHPSLHDESLSPTLLSFSSADCLYNSQAMTDSGQTTPTPSNRQTIVNNRHATPYSRKTPPEITVFESDTRNMYVFPSHHNIGDD